MQIGLGSNRKERNKQPPMFLVVFLVQAGLADKHLMPPQGRKESRQLKTENFNTAEKIAPTQRDREKLAAQQAAGEMPSLSERILGGVSGADPSQLAREAAARKFELDRLPYQGRGDTPTGRLGEEQSTLGKETLQALN
jgi:hypothetical protein